MLWLKDPLEKKQNRRTSMTILNFVKQWVIDRAKERTSWDGGVLIAAGVGFIVLGPLAKVAAYIAIAYGAWTIWKKEGHHIVEAITEKTE
jgi:hypothetical protein